MDDPSRSGMMPATFFTGATSHQPNVGIGMQHQQWPVPLLFNPIINPSPTPVFDWNGPQWRGNRNSRGGRGGRWGGRQSGRNQQANLSLGSQGRPSLTLPAPRKKRKKDVIFQGPLEPVTVDPVVREPQTEAEKSEIEAWKAQRRLNWPTDATVERKKREAAERRSRGELGPEEVKRRQTLRDILHKQRMMGLSKKAGTIDLLHRYSHHRSQHEMQRNHRRALGTTEDGIGRDDPQAGEKPHSPPQTLSAAGGGLEALMAYDSDGDGGGNEDDQGGGGGCRGGDGGVIDKKGGLQHSIEEKDSSTKLTSSTRQGRTRQTSASHPTLLEKLLAKEIRKERSYLLQAIRFFVMNDFFKNYAPGTSLLFPDTGDSAFS